MDAGNEGGLEKTRHLNHECSILDNRLGVIKIKIDAHLGNEDHIVVQTKYKVLGSRPILRKHGCLHHKAYWPREWKLELLFLSAYSNERGPLKQDVYTRT
jgi:hypothetical protein